MIREIVTDLEKLNVRAEKATVEDEPIAQDLIDTMESLSEGEEGCVCLAANQIGFNKAVIVFYDAKGTPQVMYNPKMKQAMKAYKVVEGCMCFEEEHKVTRYDTIKVTYQVIEDGELVTEQKKFMGQPAQYIQHCMDHCAGKLV